MGPEPGAEGLNAAGRGALLTLDALGWPKGLRMGSKPMPLMPDADLMMVRFMRLREEALPAFGVWSVAVDDDTHLWHARGQGGESGV